MRWIKNVISILLCHRAWRSDSVSCSSGVSVRIWITSQGRGKHQARIWFAKSVFGQEVWILAESHHQEDYVSSEDNPCAEVQVRTLASQEIVASEGTLPWLLAAFFLCPAPTLLNRHLVWSADGTSGYLLPSDMWDGSLLREEVPTVAYAQLLFVFDSWNFVHRGCILSLMDGQLLERSWGRLLAWVLVPVASGEPFDVGLLFTYFGPKFWDYAVRNRKGLSSRILFVNLPSAFIWSSSWTCSWSTINGDNFAWQRDYSNCLYDRNWFLEHKTELQNELCFSAGLMKFLRFLKFVYLFFQSKICWWGEIPDWFHYGL